MSVNTPITVINPYNTVTLLHGITSSIDALLTFHVVIEKKRDDIEVWDIVKDFGIKDRVSVTANIEMTFTEAYGSELTYYILTPGVYRWNALLYATEAHPEDTQENFYSYFTATFDCHIQDTSIPACDSGCYPNLISDCDITWIDNELRDYFCIRGFPVTIYLITRYSPIYVFGEDPVKAFGASFVTKAIWEPSPENKTLGKWEKTSDEPLQLFLHRSTIRKQIQEVLLESGIFSEESSQLPDEVVSKEIRWRRELQEQDMLRTNFNNIHYEISSVKQEPEFMYFLSKYVYQIMATPRLVAAEELGDMQSVTDSEVIRQEHDRELEIESEKILF